MGGDRIYVVDAGTGSSRVLSAMRVPQGKISAILLTHFHSDHIDGLGEMLLQRWVNGSHTSPTPIIGPPGVAPIVRGLNLAYGADHGYRVAHHGEKTLPPGGAGAVARLFRLPDDGEGVVVVDDGGWKITAFRVDHSPVSPAVGYRFDYEGRSVVLSGDTVKSANVEKFAQGVDLLIHEALSPTLVDILTEGARRAGRPNLVKITSDIKDYHATPVEAAEIARDAGVGYLVYYHTVPPLLLAPMETIFLEGVAAVYDGPVTISVDGTLISLPAGSQAIEVEELL
jgi:ribonuclease Z